MKKLVKILTGILGFLILVPGLTKFTEPFKTIIFKHLVLIGFPFPDVIQYVVKLSEIGVGCLLLFIAFKGNGFYPSVRDKLYYLGNFTVVVMMIVAVYTHLHPNVPAEILPMEFKPPFLPLGYMVLVAGNICFLKKIV